MRKSSRFTMLSPTGILRCQSFPVRYYPNPLRIVHVGLFKGPTSSFDGPRLPRRLPFIILFFCVIDPFLEVFELPVVVFQEL